MKSVSKMGRVLSTVERESGALIKNQGGSEVFGAGGVHDKESNYAV